MSMYESDQAMMHVASTSSVEPAPAQDFGSNDFQQMLFERQQRAEGGGHASNPEWGAVNDDALQFQRGDKVEIDTAFGMARAHTGRGGQPMITTRASEFDGKSVGHTYPEMITALKRSGKSDQEIAGALLKEDASAIPDGVASNAAAKLMAVTQFAEESRNPSSGKYFRAALRYVAANGNLRDVILRLYIPAKEGGTRAMREFLQRIGEDGLAAELDAELGGYASDASGDEGMG